MATKIKFSGIPINKKFKENYRLEITKETGKISFSNYTEVKQFIERVNQQRESVTHPERTLKPGKLYALFLINRIYNHVIRKFIEKTGRDINSEAKKYIREKIGKKQYLQLMDRYKEDFLALKSETSDIFLDMILVRLNNENPGARKFKIMFNDAALKSLKYDDYFAALAEFLQSYLLKDFNNENILTFMRKSFQENPDSLEEQLQYMIKNWSHLIGDEFADLLRAIDYLKEEKKFGLPGPGPSHVLEFLDEEAERFSEDKDWMSHLVLIAKSTYVWLSQLRQKYSEPIYHLDEIPEAEIALLARQGFTGLWLIGIWERSKASEKIKRIMGNEDAIASAYSLEDYRVAANLGGEEAYDNLKQKCRKYGIKLATDMVPNHTGIDSKWIVEHPDWFLQLSHSPFPNYSFTGQNLSSKPEVDIYIEDHYYDQTDAAVVFKLYDLRDNRVRYIYHGNDGTSFPWNDTAQLDYTKAEVRKAVIDQIIEVAKRSKIIRFDAAMTLAKKHYRRLWFPAPGEGGDIPTRSQYGLTEKEFNKLIPKEFWREVVERIGEEVPDTLLLAEAFWMMEGYFVRNLGMHRVYNSAFMNMLKDEENAKYRKSIFNIIEYNPEILKRFVNFMSNPDEETAIAQFGSGDKYFGVCVLMVTMPGLPMFAHGQIEGFHERYGMEFVSNKWDEKVNEDLVERHRREIFPLMRKKDIFSEAQNFLLFDFRDEGGNLNENVFAYTNFKDNQFSLVVYNNKFQHTKGWIKYSNTVERDNDKTFWITKNLGEVLGLKNSEHYYTIFTDATTGLSYIRNSAELCEKGIFQDLGAYKYAVYLDFYEVKDDKDHRYRELAKYLQGGGTKDIDKVLRKLEYYPYIKAFGNYIKSDNIKKLLQLTKVKTKEYKIFLDSYLNSDIEYCINQIAKKFINESSKLNEKVTKEIKTDIEKFIKNIEALVKKLKVDNEKTLTAALLYFILIRKIGKLTEANNFLAETSAIMHEFFFLDEIENSYKNLNLAFSRIEFVDLIIFVIENYEKVFLTEISSYELGELIFTSEYSRNFLHVNEFEDKYWFNKENFDTLLNLLLLLEMFSTKIDDKKAYIDFKKVMEALKIAEKSSEFQVKKLLKVLKKLTNTESLEKNNKDD